MRAGGIGASLVAVLLACAAPGWAAEGDLDPSFGNGGRVATTVGSNPRQNGMAIDAQGRILVVGEVNVTPSDANMVVARYLPDGTLDPSFNGFGLNTYDFPAAND